MQKPIFCLIGLCLLLSSACAAAQTSKPAMPAPHSADADRSADMAATLPRDPDLKPVFEEFGGKPGLTAIVDDLMKNLMADPRTRHFFADVDRIRVKAKLVEQFCVILGGPCTYTGDSMQEVHRGLDIRRADFNALVEDLQKAMNQHDVPFRAQNKLLAKLAPMHRIIDEQ